MTEQWLTIRYRDFYDLPRAMLVEFGGDLFFFSCPFQDELDEYGEEFFVYQVPEALRAEIDQVSWLGLDERMRLVGAVPVSAMEFDPSKRRALNSRVFDRLGAG